MFDEEEDFESFKAKFYTEIRRLGWSEQSVQDDLESDDSVAYDYFLFTELTAEESAKKEFDDCV